MNENQPETRNPNCSRPKPTTTLALIGDRAAGDNQSLETTIVEAPDTGGLGGATDSDLPALAKDIDRAYRRSIMAISDALDHARRAGALLIQVKEQVGHGDFQEWIRCHCKFEYRMAAEYMKVSRRWSQIEEHLKSKVQRNAHLTVTAALKLLARPKAGPESGEPRSAVKAIFPAASMIPGQSPMAAALGRSHDHVGESDEVAPEARDAVEERSIGGSSPRTACRATADPVPPAARRDASPVIVEDGGTEPNLPAASTCSDYEGQLAGPAIGPVSGGIAVDERGKLFAADFCQAFRCSKIPPKLQRVGSTRAFVADSTAWRLLRPVADAFLSRHRPGGQLNGLFSPSVVALILAPSPEDWVICPRCDGAGRVDPDKATCETCSGTGYCFA